MGFRGIQNYETDPYIQRVGNQQSWGDVKTCNLQHWPTSTNAHEHQDVGSCWRLGFKIHRFFRSRPQHAPTIRKTIQCAVGTHGLSLLILRAPHSQVRAVCQVGTVFGAQRWESGLSSGPLWPIVAPKGPTWSLSSGLSPAYRCRCIQLHIPGLVNYIT